MGIYYYSVLLYGFEIDIEELCGDDEDCLDDPENVWDIACPFTDVTIKIISWRYDGDQHVYVCMPRYFFQSEAYSEMILPPGCFGMDKEAVDKRLKKAALSMNVTPGEPRWHLMTRG